MENKEIVKEYTKGDFTVVWKPQKCIHSAHCVHSLPKVYDPKAKPWIKPENASEEELIDQINKCPSGALTYYIKGEKMESTMGENTKIQIVKNGPLIVQGSLDITDEHGAKTLENKTTAFCRCGASNNKPYCDGTHKKIGFSDD